jgi:RHS repeat-associated protein
MSKLAVSLFGQRGSSFVLALLLGVLYSAQVTAQSNMCFDVTYASVESGSGFTWTGHAPTFEIAAANALALDTDCWSNGQGGCLPLSPGPCSPSGAPNATNHYSGCEFISSEFPGWWGSIFVTAIATGCEYWLQAPPPPKNEICSKDCVGDPVNPGIGNVYTTESDETVATPAGSISFQRFYDSADATGTDMGPGWRHSYDRSVNAILLPANPAIYPGQSATVSPQFSDPESACTSGFAAIQSQVNGWQTATASYNNNVCVVSVGTNPIGTVLLYSPFGTPPQASPVEYDVIRDDGQIVRYTSQNGVINNQPGISLKLALTSSGFTVTDEQDNVETYNASGVLQTIATRAGVVQTIGYDSSGRLSGVTDSFGNTLTISRNANEQIGSVALNGGPAVQYAYDVAFRLSTVTNADTTTRGYQYADSRFANALTGVVDETGTQLSGWTYDAQERGISTQEAAGAGAMSLAYNADGTVTTTDALGAVRTFTYTRVGDTNRPIGISGSQCPACRDSLATTYDVAGFVSSRTDYNGNLTCYSNDPIRGLELVRVEGFAPGSSCPASLSSYTPASGTAQRKISTTWHASYRLPTLITEFNRTTAFGYDTSGNLLTKTITDTSVTPNVVRTWTYTNDAYGRVLTVNGPRTDVTDVTTYTYYTCVTGAQCGQVQTMTDALGHLTTYNTYNAYGQPLTITDPNNVVTSLTYDARQRLTSRQVGSETTGFSYYPTGLLQTVTLRDTTTIQYTYDSAHRLTKIADGAGNSIQYTLDAMGNRTAESAYDPSLTLDRTLSRVFNTLSELSEQIGAAGTMGVTTSFGYDANGNQTSVDAPLARNTAKHFDALNRISQVTDPNTGNTSFSYDGEDRLLSVKDPRNLTTSYTYNGFGDLKTQVSPDTGTTTDTYDSGGNLATSKDARAKTATYSYDALNRLTKAAYGDQTIVYSYDAGTNGEVRLTGASDSAHSMSWQYDLLGRVTSKGQTVSGTLKSVSYAYTNGDLTTLTTPSGQTVTYTYSNHQVTGIVINGTALLSAVAYESFGPARGWSWGNGTSEVRLYNTDGNPSQFSAIESTTYTEDNAFRITSIANSSNAALSWTYGYDLLDRLNSASKTGTSQSWTFDANGNRLTQGGTVATTYTVSATKNQITKTTGTPARTYTYDADGNVLTYASDTFTYNNRGRMATAKVSSATTTYVYNALGQRIMKSGGPAGTVVYAYDEAGHLLGEYGVTGSLVQETVWLGDIPVATIRPNGASVAIYYVHADHLNAPKMITRPSDNKQLWRWDQDPFGTAVPNQNPQSLGTFVYNLRFPGQYYDSETGLNYNYFRDYDPQVGRYVESDPIGMAGGTNTYAYTGDRPVGEIDDTGLIVHVDTSDPVAAALLMQAYAKLNRTKRGMAITRKLESSCDVYTIRPIKKDAFYCPAGTRAPQCQGMDKSVFVDPYNLISLPTTDGMEPTPLAVALGHELGHANGEQDDGPNGMNNVLINENPIREALGLPDRTDYYVNPPYVWTPNR